jgi:hypothetical protein
MLFSVADITFKRLTEITSTAICRLYINLGNVNAPPKWIRTIQQVDKTRIPFTHDKLSFAPSVENKVLQFFLAEKQ